MPWSHLVIRGVCKRFGSGPWILKNIDLTIKKGGFVCVLGPSGCGKSTLLDMLAGFERPTQGSVAYDDREIGGPGSDRVVIFQDVSNALFPWLTVAENIAFGLKGAPRENRKSLCADATALVELTGHEHKFPSELSGGMKQRAQIARALVMEPEALLMDEPFAAVDAFTRRKLQVQLKALWARTGKTIVFITHDISEALFLGTKVVVMSSGPSAHILDEFEPAIPDGAAPTDPAWGAAYRRIEARIEAPAAAAAK